MSINRILLLIFLLLSSVSMLAQEIYFTTRGAYITSRTFIKTDEARDFKQVPRFSAFPHIQLLGHYEYKDRLAFYAGISHYNVGMSIKDSVRHTYRALSVAVPIGIMIGEDEANYHVFLGLELEQFYHYKEKHFFETGKVKMGEFLSKKLTPTPVLSVHGGFEFPGGFYIKGKYYLGDFINQDAMVRPLGLPQDLSKELHTHMLQLTFGFRIRIFSPTEDIHN